jgi:hypothetical protein
MRDRRCASLPPPSGRSRIGTGRTLHLEHVDGRSLLARRYREVLAELLSDIGTPSAAQIQIARRATTLSVWAEAAEAQLAAGKQIDIASFTTAANTMRRLLADLPQIDPKDITPDGPTTFIVEYVQSDGTGGLCPTPSQENTKCPE